MEVKVVGKVGNFAGKTMGVVVDEEAVEVLEADFEEAVEVGWARFVTGEVNLLRRPGMAESLAV